MEEVSDKQHKTKAEKRQEKYLKQKEYRKVKRKLNRKNKKLKVSDDINEDVKTISRKVIAKTGVKMCDSSCKIKVVVDCSFDDLMSTKDVSKLQNQISNSYGVNRRSPMPLQFFVTSFNKKLEDKFEHTGNPIGEYKSWDVNFHGVSI